jgi:hypothetical protein
MIICHPLRLIFLKCIKVGGTSFEIALSRHCGPRCVITPILKRDETVRLALGYRGAQNYENTAWYRDGEDRPYARSRGTFVNHFPAASVRRAIPPDIWRDYRVVAIVRNPFEVAVSAYFWEGNDAHGTDFDTVVERRLANYTANETIAPVEGPDAPDIFLRFENLAEDVPALGVPGLWEDFSRTRAKSGVRPAGAKAGALFARHPEARERIAAACAATIARFGYTVPPE